MNLIQLQLAIDGMISIDHNLRELELLRAELKK
jgi:hypothetical protein